MFMGGEIGQWREWNHDWQLDWEGLGDPRHAGLQRWVHDLNHAYQELAALWDEDFDPAGFSWIDCNDHEQSIIALIRRTQQAQPAQQADHVVAVVNFTPVVRYGYRVGVPAAGEYHELLNSDADVYGGSNVGNQGVVPTAEKPSHGYEHSLSLTVPPLGFLLLKPNK
jgi:1,4-alpha-glucan branching enzyme